MTSPTPAPINETCFGNEAQASLSRLLETSRRYLLGEAESSAAASPATVPVSNFGDQASRLIHLLSDCLAPPGCRCTG